MDLTFDEVMRLPVAKHPEWRDHMVIKYQKPPAGTPNALVEADDEPSWEEDRDDDADDDDDDGEYRENLRTVKKKRPVASADTKPQVTQAKQQSLTLHRNQYVHSKLSSEEHISIAFREFIQNLFDQGAQNNGTARSPSFANMWFVQGKHNGSDVTCLHNGRVRLAEIIHNEHPKVGQGVYFADFRKMETSERPEFATLTFINYGAVLSSQSQLLAIGDSSKHGKSNQVGMHGEGLKTAILRMLHCGVGVEIEACVLGFVPNPITQRFRFGISQDARTNGMLAVTTTNIVMKPLVKGARDRVRFALKLTYNRTPYMSMVHVEEVEPQLPALGFSLDNYLIDRRFVRNRRDDNDWGSLVPLEDGCIWAWNMFVMKDAKNIRFAYNLFVRIGRDRDNIRNDVIQWTLTQIWNAIFADATAQAEHAKFFALLDKKEPETQWFEYDIIKGLSAHALQLLRSMYVAKYSPTTDYFVTQEESVEAADYLTGMTAHILPKGLHKVLGFPTLAQIQIEHQIALSNAPPADPEPDGIPYAVYTMFRKYIIWKKAPPEVKSRRCLSVSPTGEKTLYVNWPLFAAVYPTEEAMLDALVTDYLPRNFKSDWSVVPFLQRPVPPKPAEPEQPQASSVSHVADFDVEPMDFDQMFEIFDTRQKPLGVPRKRERQTEELVVGRPESDVIVLDGTRLKLVKVAFALVPEQGNQAVVNENQPE